MRQEQRWLCSACQVCGVVYHRSTQVHEIADLIDAAHRKQSPGCLQPYPTILLLDWGQEMQRCGYPPEKDPEKDTDTPQPKWQLARLVPSERYPQVSDQGKLLWVSAEQPKRPEHPTPLHVYGAGLAPDQNETCVLTPYVGISREGIRCRIEVPADVIERYPIFLFKDTGLRIFELWRLRGGEPESLLDGEETTTHH